MAAAVVLASPPPMAGLVSLDWGSGACNLQLFSSIHRLRPPQAARRDRRRPHRPSLSLHRQLHIHRFLPDGRPWTYEIVDLPDRVRDASSLFSPPRIAREIFTDMVQAMEYSGLPNEALEHVIETVLFYVRDVAAWALRQGAAQLSTQVWAVVHVGVVLEEETMRDDYGGHPPWLPTAVRMESRGMDGQLVGGGRAGTGCGEEEEEKECCAICLEGMAGDQRRWLPCSHVFHGDCVGRWLLQKAECPLCRFQVGTALR